MRGLIFILTMLIPSLAYGDPAQSVMGSYAWLYQDTDMKLEQIAAQGDITSRSCDALYSRVFADRQLSIALAFGYFDVS
ncbi:MAG: hypothetical protein KDD22_06290, partial [Bdellovibrionales bacterium]|nr:hypothetical protein [Bdellovibrionales bacterium]